MNKNEHKMNKNELKKMMCLAIGWAYADCFVALDNGGDPRKMDMADAIQRAETDLLKTRELTCNIKNTIT